MFAKRKTEELKENDDFDDINIKVIPKTDGTGQFRSGIEDTLNKPSG